MSENPPAGRAGKTGRSALPSRPNKSSGRTGRYFKYAIGEILLVVIGILLALQINNWNENRKERTKEIEILSQLKNDLNQILLEIGEDVETESHWIQLTDSIIHYNPETSTRPFAHYFIPGNEDMHYLNDVKLYPPKSTYENLKTVGLELLEDPKLRLKLIDLYERLLPRVELWENLVYDYNDRLLRLSEQHFIKTPIKPKNNQEFVFLPKDFEMYNELNEFKNALVTYNVRRHYMVDRYLDVKVVVEDILKLIEIEGDKK